MLKYIEFCAGGGGMRAGLDAAGWQCQLAIDNDPDAVAVHNLAHGHALQADVTELSREDIPQADAWVAGFPCQPFSTSGSRAGFAHRSGNVFEDILRLMSEQPPPILLLENVAGLLVNKSGHTMAVILAKLNSLGYSVSWLLIDLRWLGVPQTRPRLFLFATQPRVVKLPALVGVEDYLPGFEDGNLNGFGGLLQSLKIKPEARSSGDLQDAELRLRPVIGKARPNGERLFGNLGYAEDGVFRSFNTIAVSLRELENSMGAIVAPNFKYRDALRSGRFYARGGPTRLCLRSEPISHCIGTSLGGAPLFSVPLKWVKKATDRAAFLEFSNWCREQDGLLVMRLRPCRAVKLFGTHTDDLFRALTDWQVGDTRKYKIVGNMVAPVCAQTVAGTINAQLSPKFRKGLSRTKTKYK